MRGPGIEAVFRLYQVMLLKSEEGYSVPCPSLLGCHSQGETREEAIENIRDAIAEYKATIAEKQDVASRKKIRVAFELGWTAVMLGTICLCRPSGAQKDQRIFPRSGFTTYSPIPWRVGHVYHIVEHIAPSTSGTRPEPPVEAVVASGKCRVSHFSLRAWKPGRSNILLVQYDYTPLDTATLHSHVIHLLNKSGGVAAEMTYTIYKKQSDSKLRRDNGAG